MYYSYTGWRVESVVVEVEGIPLSRKAGSDVSTGREILDSGSLLQCGRM